MAQVSITLDCVDLCPGDPEKTEPEVTSADFDPVAGNSFIATAEESGIVFDLTGLTQGWIEGVWPNHGVMLQPTSTGVQSTYFSKEIEPNAWRPCMEIIPQCGP